jgi:hypothetical protein
METEKFTHAGCTITIGTEDWDAEHANPRQDENYGTMVCWHPDYILGDEQVSGSRGAVENVFETERGRTDFASMEQIERYLRVMRGAVAILPLYLLDHSGISMSAGSNTVGRGDTAIPGGGTDSWNNPRGWDTSMVGFIYTTVADAEKLCGKCRRCDGAEADCPLCEGTGLYCPDDWTGTARGWAVKQLREEVRYYDAYLQGSVYYYTVEDADGELVDSMGGMLVADYEELESYVKAEAKEAAEDHAHRLALDEEPDTERAIYERTR